MIGSLVFFFCLKNYIIANHINSVMPGGDRSRVLPRNFGEMMFLKNWENVSALAFPIQPGSIEVCEPGGRV